MLNIQGHSGRTVNKKCLVSERDLYCSEKQLNCCEVRKVHDDGGDADESDDDNNNNNFFVLTFLTLTFSELNLSHLVQ